MLRRRKSIMEQCTHTKRAFQRRVSPGTLVGVLGFLVGALLAVLTLGNLGGSSSLAAIVLCVGRIFEVCPAIVFIATGVGLGSWLKPIVKGSGETAAVRGALGLALLLTLSHVLGQVGLLHGTIGFVLALGLSILGLGTLAGEAIRNMRSSQGPVPDVTPRDRVATVLWPTVCGLIAGVVLFAVVNPPGALWGSEFGGYDVLSYHLELPQEWLLRGRVESLDHNVYSFLPGYMESAYVYIAALTHAPTTPEFPGGPIGLLAGEGWRANSCQALHAMFLLGASILVAALARHLVSLCHAEPADSTKGSPRERDSRPVWIFGSLLFLLTPWSIVVGTLAYNEMPMLAMGAGAMLVATSQTLSPARRGSLSGLLVAAACGVKPTAFLFLGVPTGILLLGTMRVKHWWKAVVPGVGVALVFLAPWMIRNAMACGNPLFPYALTNWLGSAHWDAEQVQRFLHFHMSHESILDRLKLLVLPDANDPAASPGHPMYRGMTHPQWGVFFALVAIAMPHAMFWRRGFGRRLAVLLSLAIGAQVALWLLTTHVQSRFLLPLMVPGTAIVAMALCTPSPDGSAADTFVAPPAHLRRLSFLAIRVVCWLGVAAQAGFLASTIASQHDGHPALLLPFDPADFTASAWHRETNARERAQLIDSSAARGVAALVPPGDTITLLGEAAPFYYPPNVRYNTVWDRWPFKDGRLIETGVRFVLIDFASIGRYERSGYLPPEVNLRAVQEWMLRECRTIKVWEAEGKVLVEVVRRP